MHTPAADGVPGPGGRPRGIALLLGQLGAHAGRRFAERLAPLGLTPSDAAVLRHLGLGGPLSQRELADRLGTVPSRVVVLVDALEAAGLVVRQRSEVDRRRHDLALTDEGRVLLGRVRDQATAHETELLAGLSPEQANALAVVLDELTASLGLPGRPSGRQPDPGERT